MPPGSSEWEGKSEMERERHKVEIGHLLEPSCSLHHHQLVTSTISCHHAYLVGAHLQTTYNIPIIIKLTETAVVLPQQQ